MNDVKTWWNRSLGVLMTLVLAVTLAACGATEGKAPNETSGKQETTQQPQQEQKTPDALKTTYPLTVKDATGEEFIFEKAPERIVSVSPAETESLFAIGLDTEIVGVSDYDDYPEAALTKPKMGDITKPNEEAIIAAKPDIVFTGVSMSEEAVKKFRDLGIKIFKVEPKTYNDVIACIEQYGLITDHQEQAKAVVDHMKQVRDEVQTAVKDVKEKKKVYIEFAPGWTVGSGEFMNEVIEIAGGVNVAASEPGWIQLNEENVIKGNPDVILYADGMVDFDSKKPLEEIITNRSGWANIKAIQDKQVVGIDTNIISRPGPRLADGLKEVAKAIYPDLVK
ncbi:ABC transporter substrate-binding protein [Paenibacillus marinisediminis]